MTRDARDRWFLSELGDCLWYVAALATLWELRLAEVLTAVPATEAHRDPLALAVDLAVASGELQHAARREVFEAQPVAAATGAALLARVAACLRELAATRGATLSDAMDANVAKLSRRYRY